MHHDGTVVVSVSVSVSRELWRTLVIQTAPVVCLRLARAAALTSVAFQS